ncbi:hypothetical protein [Sphaerisporangium sp. TRM90804]|uniref:hypothetical protein n=1 Tax=Sphaerisporangium sp. TRM90804 TaxID=3031113 RepID=UPI00244CCAD7|nr:hypothetical protein [Sphaerisporangium sp. TRM90804]MDH2430548.1 hypothetical protein [Sphaerisporangium sp. TRM90804]
MARNRHRSPYSALRAYSAGDIVSHQEHDWQALQSTPFVVPGSDATRWRERHGERDRRCGDGESQVLAWKRGGKGGSTKSPTRKKNDTLQELIDQSRGVDPLHSVGGSTPDGFTRDATPDLCGSLAARARDVVEDLAEDVQATEPNRTASCETRIDDHNLCASDAQRSTNGDDTQCEPKPDPLDRPGRRGHPRAGRVGGRGRARARPERRDQRR